MTHAELVQIAGRWLKRQGCRVVLLERPGARTGEIADAIGWKRSGLSIVIECKASVSDFRADARKRHRALMRLGEQRYYMTPKRMLGGDPSRLMPCTDGLLEVDAAGRVSVRTPCPLGLPPELNPELSLLVSVLAIYHAQGIGYRTLSGRNVLPTGSTREDRP